MLVDITLKIALDQFQNLKAPIGHMGTHFDVMDKEFPLEYTKRKGITFDVSNVKDRDIDIDDIQIDAIEKDMFVLFYSGFIEQYAYGSEIYSHHHPQLSDRLIELLIEKEISMIGIDFAGVRRGKEHTPKDQYCADHGVFIIENLCHLNEIIGESIIHTYPMNYENMTGLPCRVIAEI